MFVHIKSFDIYLLYAYHELHVCIACCHTRSDLSSRDHVSVQHIPFCRLGSQVTTGITFTFECDLVQLVIIEKFSPYIYVSLGSHVLFVRLTLTASSSRGVVVSQVIGTHVAKHAYFCGPRFFKILKYLHGSGSCSTIPLQLRAVSFSSHVCRAHDAQQV